MDWKDYFKVATLFGIVLILISVLLISVNILNEQQDLQDLNSSLLELKQADQNIQNGLGILYLGELELARGIQDINGKISLNEQALQSLDYLSKNCQRSDFNDSFILRCWK